MTGLAGGFSPIRLGLRSASSPPLVCPPCPEGPFKAPRRDWRSWEGQKRFCRSANVSLVVLEHPKMPKTEATLRVVEALQQDVSYGRARLDGQTRVELNLSPGDIIEIKG